MQTSEGLCLARMMMLVYFVGWAKGAKRRAHLDVVMLSHEEVGTLRFAHPTRISRQLDGRATGRLGRARACSAFCCESICRR